MNVSTLSEILQVAYEILSKEKELHVNDIAEKAMLMNKNMGMRIEDFTKKLNAALLNNLKSRTPFFAKPQNKNGSYKKGIYRVKQFRISKSLPAIVAPVVNTLFTGKAGEHAVMSELLFWGFNASLMSVDNGVDIVASKNNRYFHIQVKTAAPDANGRYGFNIKHQSFDTHDAGSTYYIFVLRSKNGNQYMVLPSSDIRNQKNLGVINGDLSMSIGISYDTDSKKWKLNKRHEINIYLNNFQQIK